MENSTKRSQILRQKLMRYLCPALELVPKVFSLAPTSAERLFRLKETVVGEERMPADPLVATLKTAIHSIGFEPIEVDFATGQRLKEEARQRDANLIAATPEDIQRKNTFIPLEGTEIEILDVRGSIARR